MNKKQYAYMLRDELSRINKRIDNKIMLGYSYDRDAKRHKMLLSAITKINRRERLNRWFGSFFRIHRYGRV